ncbi:MAG: hypothetical protein J5806_07770 [Lentisphaeria bacterium]|nr:hypothetical protein [Lentisphaeria bacterium]
MSNENNRFRDAVAASDSGQFSTGTAALLKLAKALFYLMTAIIVVMIIWFITFGGAVIVDGTRETVLKLHFGKYQEKYTSGYHWCLPYPINTIVRVPKTNQTIRSTTFMPANRKALLERKKEGGSDSGDLTPGKDGYLLTGDNSIVHTEWELVYKVDKPEQYYTHCLTPLQPLDPDDIVKGENGENLGTRGATTMIRNLLDDSIIKVTARWNVKNILYDRTNEYISEVKALLIRQIQERQLGISVESLALPVKRPPLQTIDAFDEAASASTQASIETETARAYAIETANSAKSEAAEIIANAQSYKERVVSEVVADKVYFTKLLEEYKKNPESVLVSLYSTTLADALAQSKDKFAIGINPGSRQELRLKLNPEPVIKKNADTEKEEKP